MNSVIPSDAQVLAVETTPGSPTVVKYEYAGHKYVVTIALVVNAAWPTGRKDPNGEHEFSLNMGYSFLGITKDGRPL